MAKRRTPGLDEISAELGRLFGTSEAHARKWLQQRDTILEALHLVRGKAAELIDALSGEDRRLMKPLSSAPMEGAHAPSGDTSEPAMGRKARRISAASRAKMRAAAKRRWARKTNG